MGFFNWGSESNSSKNEDYPDSDTYSECPHCGAPKSMASSGTHVGFFESRPSFPSEHYVVEKVKCHQEPGVRPPEYPNRMRCGRPFYRVTKYRFKHDDG